MLTLFDVILKCILIAAGGMFLIMTLMVCVVVLHYALEERKEWKRVHAVQEGKGRNGNDSGIR